MRDSKDKDVMVLYENFAIIIDTVYSFIPSKSILNDDFDLTF